jgi:hypothetical protein
MIVREAFYSSVSPGCATEYGGTAVETKNSNPSDSGRLACECRLSYKESKAERKAREQEERKQAKTAERGREAVLRLAETASLKIQAMKVQVEAVIANRLFASCSSVVAEPINKAFQELSDMYRKCQGVTAGHESVLPFDNKTLAMKVATVKKDLALGSAMLSTLARAAR